MSDATPIETPAGYAPGYAVGYADPADNLILVSETDRLPVASFPPAPAPMAGQASAPGLTGPFEAVSGLETPPYIMRQRLTIRGNGAELRNVNQTPLNVDHTLSIALPLGVSMVWTTSYLTYHSVEAASGPELTLTAGTGANFAPGNLVVLHGTTKYYGPGNEYEVYRNYTRARVVEATANTVVIDRALPAQLLADMPVIGLSGAPDYYLLYAPHVSHLKISSELGNPLQCGA